MIKVQNHLLCIIMLLLLALNGCMNPEEEPAPLYYIPEQITFLDLPSTLTDTSGSFRITADGTLGDAFTDAYVASSNNLDVVFQAQNRVNDVLSLAHENETLLYIHLNSPITITNQTSEYELTLTQMEVQSYQLACLDKTRGDTNPFCVVQYKILTETDFSGDYYIRLSNEVFQGLRVEFGKKRNENPIIKIYACGKPNNLLMIQQVFMILEQTKTNDIILQSHSTLENQPAVVALGPGTTIPEGFPKHPSFFVYGFILENGTGAYKEQWDHYIYADDFDLNAILDLVLLTIRGEFYFSAEGIQSSWKRTVSDLDLNYTHFDDPASIPTISSIQSQLESTFPSLFGININEADEDQTIITQIREGKYQTHYSSICEEIGSVISF